jgi:hypothetical protein
MLAHERTRSAAHFSSSWRGYPELETLEPELRLRVLRKARRVVRRNWLLHGSALGWVAAYASGWFFLVPVDDQRSALTVFALGATLPVPFFYGACMGRAIRKTLRSMAVTTSRMSPR